ncbi:MAG: shikimate kinase [Bacteroidota bacterium]
MATPCIIFITGMPGAGKTWWGRRLAAHYHLPFTDLDDYVAQREQASIPALFAQYGEAGFREREAAALVELIATTSTTTIIACGGGTPCHGANLQLMKQAGTVIYLQVTIPTLLANLEQDTTQRPLLKNRGDLSKYLQTLLQKRTPYYAKAHHILHTADISLTTFGQIISSCINRQ